MINKKGELTTTQIVTLVVLMISFIIILGFMVMSNLFSHTKKEICHNSVLLASKSPVFKKLNCKTTYICISNGGDCGGSADEIVEIEGYENYREQILDAIAQEMVDCWWMFGEGKIEYAPADTDYHCSICSSIVFDEDLQFVLQGNSLTYRELYEYLLKSGSVGSKKQTYLEYLYGVNNLNAMNRFSLIDSIDITDQNSKIDTTKKLAVLTGIETDVIGNIEFEEIVYPTLVQVDKISKTKCDVFDLTLA